MPYWSSSRVGAVPVGQPTKQKKRNERYGGRQKGITMEDLKKQTALRLAQEQKQSRGTGEHAANYPNTPARSNAAAYGRPVQAPFMSQTNGKKEPTTNVHFYQGRPNEIVSAPNQERTSFFAHVYRAGHENRSRVSHQFALNDEETNTIGSRGSNGNHGDNLGPQTVQYNPNTSAVPEQQRYAHASTSKPKLPHGLTVHELKEMTKARLQAEAAEKGDSAKSELGPVPSAVRASSEYRDHMARTTPLASAPPGFHPPLSPRRESDHIRSSSIPLREGWSQESRTDTWENASVSTVASDYLGSESVYSSGATAVPSYSGEDTVVNTFGKSMSFSTSHDVSNRDGSASVSVYDLSPGFVPNRRRAATLSPLPLSHQQVRGITPGMEIPGMPTFSSPAVHRPLAPRVRPSALIDETSRLGHQSQRQANQGYFFEGNRGRALSATSLPPMSHTAEEFGALDQSMLSQQICVVHEDAPTSSVSSRLADVFRDPGFGRVEEPKKNPVLFAPPGFEGRAQLSHMPSVGVSSMGNFDTRSRASTWGEPISTSDFFGPGLIGSGQQDLLASDLEAILKLSTERNDSNSLFPPPGLT